MQNLLDVKFDKFIEDFNLQDNTKDINWRRFVNYHFFSQFQPGRLDTDMDLLNQICVDSLEFSQVHGAFFLLNDQIISEPQDIEDVLERGQKGLLELYFLTFGNMNCLEEQLEELFCDLDILETDEKWILILKHAMSREVILRWKDNPILRVVSYNSNGAKPMLDFSEKMREFFSDIDGIGIDKRRLQNIVNSNENSYQAVLHKTLFPIQPNKNENLGDAYIGCMSADDLVKLMITPDGLIRRNMFDDNVRDFQGSSTVNQEISSTLEEHPERFVLFNNGITIVCRSIKTENGRYILENPQIVNGCQTCNMIYQAYRKNVNLDGVQVVAKIVGSNVEDVTQGIVRGANRQNIVYEEAFETIKEFHKELEKYFENNQVEGYQKIYYERRSKQYVDNVQIKPQQKISFRGLIQSMVALFLNHVEKSHRHEYKLLMDYKDSLFVDTHFCQPYYLAAFLYLNVDMLFKEKKLPQKLNTYKMHIMLLIKEMRGGASPDLSSKDIGEYCERLLTTLMGGRIVKYAQEACEKFEIIRTNWIHLKGEQYKSGIKDSAGFRDFLMKEVHGALEERDVEKTYVGYVMSVKLDKNNNWFGFIEHEPENVFFHEFDNPDMERAYTGKKVSYKIARNGNQERAINVRLIEGHARYSSV